MLTELDKEIIRRLQGDLPLVPRPYQVIAHDLGIEEEELLEKINWMKEKGMIRRLGAAIRHRQAGFKANAMVVWQVPTEQVADVGQKLATYPEVTHCYERPTFPDWPYNLFTMVHGRRREECEAIAQRMAQEVGIENYRLLYSTKELKKTSMKYFV